MFEGFEHRRIDVGDGITVACVVGGSGPPVLMLHGFPQTLALWARIAPLLARDFRVVAADLRGYGASSKPNELADHSNYSFRAMAADQVSVMRQLGHERFHVIGHDRGGRVGHRMALDWPGAVQSLAVLDIVPTTTMFLDTTLHAGSVYWHWAFLAQPSRFPETLIGHDPDFFFESCLVGWGRTALDDFAADQLAAYRQSWHDPDVIRGACSDYRAAATVDLVHDAADAGRKIQMPSLALWGAASVVGRQYDVAAEWKKRCSALQCSTLPGGHFFPDISPTATAEALALFLNVG